MTPAPRPTLKAAALLFACFAALAAGLVELSIAAGQLAGPSAGSVRATVAGILGLFTGAAFLSWALMALHRTALPFPKVAIPVLVAAAVVHVAAAAASLLRSPRQLDPSQLAALGLILMALAAAGWLRRHPQGDDGGSSGQPGTGRLLAAAFGAAVVVAAVATPGLAASFAGQHAVPHGDHKPQLPGAGGTGHGH